MEKLTNWITEKRAFLNNQIMYAQQHNDKTLLQVVQGKLDILNEIENQVINYKETGEN